MNGKKAKLMRKVGKVEKKDKKLYNQLTHDQKYVLKVLYTEIIERNK